MAKFHIGKNGLPATCRATKGKCPLGGSESHFETREAAQSYADEQFKKEYGIMSNLSNDKPTIRDYYEIGEIAKNNVIKKANKEGKKILGNPDQEFKLKSANIERDLTTGNFVVEGITVEVETSYEFEKNGSFNQENESQTLQVNLEDLKEQKEFNSEAMAGSYTRVRVESLKSLV